MTALHAAKNLTDDEQDAFIGLLDKMERILGKRVIVPITHFQHFTREDAKMIVNYIVAAGVEATALEDKASISSVKENLAKAFVILIELCGKYNMKVGELVIREFNMKVRN